MISRDSLVVAAISGLLATVLLLLGFLIRERGKVNLLAGYDPRQVTDPHGLARFAGTVFYQMAAATLLVPISGAFLGTLLADARNAWPIVYAGYFGFVLFMSLRLVVGARRYMK